MEVWGFSAGGPRRVSTGCPRSAELLGCVGMMSGECGGVCVDEKVPAAQCLVTHKASVASTLRLFSDTLCEVSDTSSRMHVVKLMLSVLHFISVCSSGKNRSTCALSAGGCDSTHTLAFAPDEAYVHV